MEDVQEVKCASIYQTFTDGVWPHVDLCEPDNLSGQVELPKKRQLLIATFDYCNKSYWHFFNWTGNLKADKGGIPSE